ncbi:acyl carrier protein [Streptomyces sp. Ag109_O5-10]|uniref:acyl carrier protein n=1 Tax=Streptomyces sp. Ag109_O5-10 TaxID=1855349 RepID=UPI000899C43F|nr:acyl carrier protein [Streptomyces sp. Ag109_O5-10]SEF00266.1 acyl carrier protein [Streptomyces sp. Ag109_O5-10]
MHDETRAFVLTVVRDVINLPLPDRIDDRTPLGDGGLGLESLATIELMLQLEGEYDIELPESELDPEVVSTLGDLVALVVERRSRVTAGGAAQ